MRSVFGLIPYGLRSCATLRGLIRFPYQSPQGRVLYGSQLLEQLLGEHPLFTRLSED
jgi:hypothetical protein